MNKHKKRLYDLLSIEIDPVFRKRAKFIFDQTLKIKPRNVLDAGCGRGFYSKAISSLPFVEGVVGLDVNNKYLDQARRQTNNKKIVYISRDLLQWKTKERFDLIILSEVLEHLVNDELVLQKLCQLLEPHGKIIVSVPHENYPLFWDPINYCLKLFGTHISSDIWWLAGIWADHLRLYSEKKLINSCQQANLSKLSVEQQGYFCWPFSHFLLYGVGKNLVLKAGLKSFSRFNDGGGMIVKILAMLMNFPNWLLSDVLELEKVIKLKESVGLVGVFEKSK